MKAGLPSTAKDQHTNPCPDILVLFWSSARSTSVYVHTMAVNSLLDLMNMLMFSDGVHVRACVFL